MPKSAYLSDQFIGQIFGGQPRFVGLFSNTPGARGAGAQELTGGGYGRVPYIYSVPANGAVQNTVPVLFNTATLAWGRISVFGIFDALTAGNLLYFDNLQAPRMSVAGSVLAFKTGELVVVEL